MCTEGEIRCTGDSEGWVQRRLGMNEARVLQSILGTSRSRVGTEEAKSEDDFCSHWTRGKSDGEEALFVESESSRKPFHAAKKLGEKALLWVSPSSLQLRSPVGWSPECPFWLLKYMNSPTPRKSRPSTKPPTPLSILLCADSDCAPERRRYF